MTSHFRSVTFLLPQFNEFLIIIIIIFFLKMKGSRLFNAILIKHAMLGILKYSPNETDPRGYVQLVVTFRRELAKYYNRL